MVPEAGRSRSERLGVRQALVRAAVWSDEVVRPVLEKAAGTFHQMKCTAIETTQRWKDMGADKGTSAG